MEVKCDGISKRFKYQWIIKQCNWIFPAKNITGIQGRNGSGKSTLLRIISTQLSPSRGKMIFKENGKDVLHGDLIKTLSLVGPYTELIKEFTLDEQLAFHFKFKEKRYDFNNTDFHKVLGLSNLEGKKIEAYSSGMNQRLQLALALLSDTKLLLLDEPTSFLDFEAKKWFFELLDKNKEGRTIIIASNDPEDFKQCSSVLNIANLNTVS